MKKGIAFIISLVFMLLFAKAVYCASTYDTASRFASFQPEIRLDTTEPDSVLNDIFAYDTRLQLYYGGYGGTLYTKHSVINVKYINKDVPIDKIYAVQSIDEFKSILTRGLLYCEKEVYIVFEGESYKNVDIDNIVEEIRQICPLASEGVCKYTCNTSDNSLTGDSTYRFNIEYRDDESALLEKKKKAESKAFTIVGSNIAYNMPDYVKVKIIHDYIIDNCQYATDYEENENYDYYTAFGALVNGKAVCEGYAEAAHILFDLCGIENFTISGESQGANHIWNVVKLDGDLYHIDITWDDPVTRDGINIKSYSYYNINDDALSSDHTWDRDKYEACSGAYYSYENTLMLMSNDKNIYTQPYSAFESVFSIYPPLYGNAVHTDTAIQVYELGINTWNEREIAFMAGALFVLLMFINKIVLKREKD